MNRFVLIACCICFINWGFSQNCPLNTALPIPFSDTVKYELDVFDVVNNDLSNPNQGVCSIAINFRCHDLYGLEMWLVSPAFDTVALIGPVVNTGLGGTLGSNWDIQFLNDVNSPVAEPDFPNDERFDNRVNRFSGGNYNGSYFPFQGSLEDFNRGPVNGQWQLIIHLTPDFLQVEGSQVHDIHINFCDRRGYFCCFAEAGNLRDTSAVTACLGDANLQNIDLSVQFPTGPADSATHEYTYLLSQSDTIIGYDSLPDPSQFSPGTYQITGFSYQKNQRDSLPTPDSHYTLSSLRDTLNSDLPPFCGRLTPNNRTITVLPKPDTTFLGLRTICEEESLIVAGIVLDSVGNYLLTIPASNGCDSLIQVELNIRPNIRDTIIETTCNSGPFLSRTGNILEGSGFYSFSYDRPGACDSVVVVDFRNYSISPVILPSAGDFSCQDSLITLDGSASSTSYGSFSYRWEAPPFGQVISTDSVVQINQPGRYTLQLIHEEACPPIQTSIRIDENYTAPEVALASAPPITCIDSSVQINVQSITGTGPYQYRWEDNNGDPLTNFTDLSAQVDRPGSYRFILTDEENGCRDTAMVQVALDTLAPAFSITGEDTLTCSRTELRPEVDLLDPNRNYRFEWLNSQGQLIPQGTTSRPRIRTSDTFQLTLIDQDNGCRASQIFRTWVDTIAPQADIAPAPLLDCQVREIDLMASSSQSLEQVVLSWTSLDGGNIIAGDSSLSPRINAAGTYQLSLSNSNNNCSSQTQVIVRDTSTNLTAIINQESNFSCTQNTSVLTSEGSSSGSTIQYRWTDLDHGTFSNLPGSSVMINQPGRYQLLVQDTFTHCLEVSTLITTSDTVAPAALTGPPAQLDCNQAVVTLGDEASAQDSNLQYAWQGPCLISRPDSAQVQVDCPGTYLLRVLNQRNGCQSSNQVQVSRDTSSPTAIISDSIAIDCSTGLAFLDASASFGGELEWFYEGNSLNTNEDSLLVVNPGQYTLRVSNPTLQCTDEREVTVSQDCQPEAIILPPDSLDCGRSSVVLDASTSKGEALNYQWIGPGGATCFSQGDSSSARVSVSCAGNYQLIVRNRQVNESDTTHVEVVEDLNLPQANAGMDIVLTCEQSSIDREAQLAGNPPETIYRWKTSFGFTLSEEARFSFRAGGTYVLEVENPSNNCIRRDTLLVTEPELPNLEIRRPEVLTCIDSSVTLEPLVFTEESVLSYHWEGKADQSISAPNQRTIEVREPGLYQLRVTDTTNQCTFTDSIEVLIDRAIPQVEAGADTSLNCNTPQLVLNGQVDAPSSSLQFRWFTERSNGLVSGEDSLTATVQDTGIYRLLVLDLDNGCLGIDSIRVLSPPPLPSLLALKDTAFNCTNQRIRLMSPIQDTVNYLLSWTGWTDAGQSIDTSQGTQYWAEATGSYLLIAQDRQSGCTRTQTIQLTNDTLAPAFRLSIPDTLNCQETEIQLNTTSPVDTALYSIEWTSNNGFEPAGDLPLRVQLPGDYTLRIQNLENGCVQEETVSVQENINQPLLELKDQALLSCRIDTLLLSPLAPNNVQAQWTGPAGGLLSPPDSLNARLVRAGSYQLEVRDPNTGCTNQSTVTVLEDKTAPVLQIDSSRNLTISCIQTSVELAVNQVTTSSGQEAQFEWNSLFGISTEPSLRVTEAQSVDLQVTDPQNGCTTSYQFVVEQDQEQPRFRLNTDGTLGCGKDTVLINAEFVGQSGLFEFLWSREDEQIQEETNSSIQVKDPGLYRLQSTNPQNGCSYSEEIRVLLNAGVPRIRIAVDTSLNCETDAVELSAVIENYSPQALEFSWSTTDGFIQGSSNTERIVATEQGTYVVRAINERSTCQAEASGVVLRQARSIKGLNFTVLPEDCDPNGGGQLSISTVEGGTGPFLFDFNDSGFKVDKTLPIEKAGTYPLAVEDVDGCRYDTTVQLSPKDLPLVDLGPDQVITRGDSIRLKVNLSNDQYERLEWISGNSILASQSPVLVVAPAQTTAYRVRTVTEEGCIFEDVIWVYVEEASFVYLPTAFSPNEDGYNDRLLPGFHPNVSQISQFYVYDRWGNTVYTLQNASVQDTNLGWDGQHRGQPMPSAVYVYWLEVVLANGETRQVKGEALLVR